MWPNQLAFLPSFFPFIVCRIFLFSLTPSTSSFLTRSAQLCSPSFSSTTLQNIQAISDLISEASRFQYCAIQFSKCNISLVSPLNLRPIFWWQDPSSSQSCCCHYNPGLNFTSTSCTVCYHVAQTVAILNIRRLILIYRNPYWRRLPSDSHYLILSTCISIPTSLTVSKMPCSSQ